MANHQWNQQEHFNSIYSFVTNVLLPFDKFISPIQMIDGEFAFVIEPLWSNFLVVHMYSVIGQIVWYVPFRSKEVISDRWSTVVL